MRKVHIISANSIKGQKFFLIPKGQTKLYHEVIANLINGIDIEKGEITDKVSVALNMDTLCVSLMEDTPKEVIDKVIINALKLKVVVTDQQRREMELKDSENVFYQRVLNTYLIIDANDKTEIQKAINAFVKLGGKIGFVKCSKDNPCEKEEYCVLEDGHIGKCILEEFFDTKTKTESFW